MPVPDYLRTAHGHRWSPTFSTASVIRAAGRTWARLTNVGQPDDPIGAQAHRKHTTPRGQTKHRRGFTGNFEVGGGLRVALHGAPRSSPRARRCDRHDLGAWVFGDQHPRCDRGVRAGANQIETDEGRKRAQGRGVRFGRKPKLTPLGGALPTSDVNGEGGKMIVRIASSQQIATAEIVEGQKDSFKIVPPNHGRDIIRYLPDRRRDLPQYR
jgi:hypothetical protein